MSRHSAEFFAHWKSLPCSHGIPHTRTFLDRAIPLMSTAFIFELVPDGSLIRFMGSGLVARWQRDFTGDFIETHMKAGDRAPFRRKLEVVCKHPVGMRVAGEASTSSGRTLDYEMIVLPLAVDCEKPQRCVAYRHPLVDLNFNECKVGFTWSGDISWIDIGSGTPSPCED